MLKIAMAYDIVTQESAENGDFAESGFVFESCDCTARELADYIKRDGFNVPSQSYGVVFAWLSTDPCEDYTDGSSETRSIHPGGDAQSQKVWAKVLAICGVIK